MSYKLNIQKVPLSEVPIADLQTESASDPPVVLVVEDEKILADTRAAILASWGYAVMTAYTAERALEMASLNPPKALVTNVILNRVKGADLARAIQSKSSDCQVILLSGIAEGDSLAADARNAGCSFTLLRKPVHPRDLKPLLPEIAR
jgi:DNA-binding NtrC family response regulator